MDQNRSYAIFISHHPDDLDFVEDELLPRLAAAGLTAATGENLRGGVNRLAEMARLIRTSRHTLALVTPAWLTDGLADFQAQLSQHFDPGARRQRFVPLLKGVASLPTELAALQAVDLNDPQRWQRRLQQLAEQLAEQLAQLSRPTPPPVLDPRLLYTAPRPATLYGRDELIAQIVAELSDPRGQTALALTALRGLPGVGKSALALALAHHPALATAFPDGIFWVALGPQMDENSLLAELARFIAALGGSALGLTSPEQHSRALAALWQGRRALLILDDCWNPAHARPFRDALPAASRCLLTTRRAGIADDLGAATRNVPLLNPAPSLEVLAAGGPLARQAVEGNPKEAAGLADALGHLPLALEVAARYLQKLAGADGPPAALRQLATELAEETGRLLRLTAAERRLGLDGDNPSLEAVLALSYNALADDASRNAFVRLAVCGSQPLSFEAGVMAALWQAGEMAVGESQRNEWRAELVDAGLLTRLEVAAASGGATTDQPGEPPGEPPPRYSLHQTVAAYARARLDESGQRRAMELTHAAYYQTIVANYDEWDAEGRMNYAAPVEWDGVTLAIERLVAVQATDDEAAQLLIRYSHHWRNVLYNNHNPRRADWLSAAVRAAERIGNSLDQANVLQAQGDVLSFQDKRDEALEKYARALGLYQAVGDRLGEANVLRAQGDVLYFQKETDEALEKYARALGLFQAVGARLGEANVLKAQGDVLSFQDKRDEALEKYARALGLFQAVGDRLGEANVLQAQGDVLRILREYTQAEEHYQQALALYQLTGARQGEANSFLGLGRLALAQEDWPVARSMTEEAVARHTANQDRYSTALDCETLAQACTGAGDSEAAMSALRIAASNYSEIGLLDRAASVLTNLGNLFDEAERLEDGLEIYVEAAALLPDAGWLQRNVADSLIRIVRLDEAEAQLDRAAQIEPDAPYLALHRAALAKARGDRAAGREWAEEALRRSPDWEEAQALLDWGRSTPT